MVFTYEGVCLGCGKKVEIEGPLCYNGMGVRCDECRDKPWTEPRNSEPMSLREKLWVYALTIGLSTPLILIFLGLFLTIISTEGSDSFRDNPDYWSKHDPVMWIFWLSKNIVIQVVFAILTGIVAILFLVSSILKKTRPEDSGSKP